MQREKKRARLLDGIFRKSALVGTLFLVRFRSITRTAAAGHLASPPCAPKRSRRRDLRWGRRAKVAAKRRKEAKLAGNPQQCPRSP